MECGLRSCTYCEKGVKIGLTIQRFQRMRRHLHTTRARVDSSGEHCSHNAVNREHPRDACRPTLFRSLWRPQGMAVSPPAIAFRSFRMTLVYVNKRFHVSVTPMELDVVSTYEIPNGRVPLKDWMFAAGQNGKICLRTDLCRCKTTTKSKLAV